MGMLQDFLLAEGAIEPNALRALHQVIRHADGRGRVERDRLSADAADGLPHLMRAGLLELDRDATDGVGQWSSVRLAPAALADLLEAEIDSGRQRLLSAVEARLAGATRSRSAPPAISVREPLPEPAPPQRGAAAAAEPPAESDEADGEPPAQDVRAAAETSGTAPHVLAPRLNGSSTLSSRGLVKVYKKRRVVNEVDLYLRQGEIVGLLGPNGAGKTTTFYMVVGLIKPDRGKVFLSRNDVTDVPMYRRARRGIGYLAQEPSIFRKLTVEENVKAVLQMLGLSRREQRERLEALLDELGIKHLRETKAYALSGGERRRLEITRALVGNPKFMLLDEPFAGVDPIAVHDIQQIVADLRRRGIGVLISDHNVEQTLDIVDRAYIMYDGRVRVSGTVSELVWNDEVAEIYLGPTLTARMRQRYSQPQ